jgi:hypothetical protein
MARPRPIKVCRPERGGTRRGVAALLNLGPRSSAWLAGIGITTREQLARLGPVETCRRLRAAGHPVNTLMAYAVEGALTGTHWNEIPPETKRWLQAQMQQLKRERHSPQRK